MRVLVVTRVPPYPLNNGGAHRSRAILVALAKRHEVTLSCPMPAASRVAAEQALGPLVSQFLWVDPEDGVPLRIPITGTRSSRLARYLGDALTHWTPLYFRYPNDVWRNLLTAACNSNDAVLCRHMQTVPLIAKRCGKIVVDTDDLSFIMYWQETRSGDQGYGSVLYLLETLRSFLAEQWIAWRSARTLVVSETDRRRLWSRSTTLVPNGVNLESQVTTQSPTPGRVAFIGDCGWDPNKDGLEWFVREVWPAIQSRHPEGTFVIVGKSANLAMLPFADARGIILAENVPSVRPWFESAAVSVVPLHKGAGTRIKILESLGYGTPVVSTPVGAAGLTGVFGPDQGLVVTDTAHEMVTALSRILEDPAELRAAASRGGAIVRERFTWEAATQPIVEHFDAWVTQRLSDRASRSD
jgi:glycosyltransferase involved in cell wall biosynthesis